MSEVTRALALQMVALDLQIKLAAAGQRWADAHELDFARSEVAWMRYRAMRRVWLERDKWDEVA